MLRSVAASAVLLSVLFASPALADDYVRADFSAGIFGGNANARDPLRDPYFPGDLFTGSFVYDVDLVPLPGSGFVNVGFNSFPDIGDIPNADAFTFNFGPQVFTLADDPLAMIQYNNGQFNGFVFNTTFLFEGENYLFNLSGGQLRVNSQADPFGQPYINGYINIGNAALANQVAYTPPITPPPAVPEPSTWAIMLIGFGAVGGAMRSRRRERVIVSYA